MARKKAPFDMVRLVAEMAARFPHQYKMPGTVDVYLADCKKILGDLTPEQLKAAYDSTIKKWNGRWAPRPLEILANAPVTFVADKDFNYDRDLRAYIKDNKARIEGSFRQAFVKQIHKAENNGWGFCINDLIKHLVFVQAWYDFGKKSLDILTPEGRVTASKYNSIVGSRNPGRSDVDTFMFYVNNEAKRVTIQEKTGPFKRPGKFISQEEITAAGGELDPDVDQEETEIFP